MREFSKETDGCLVVHSRGFNNVGVAPQFLIFNSGSPVKGGAIPTNSLVSRFIIGALASVLIILARKTLTKIFFSIVERVVVNVVNGKLWTNLKNFSVHKNYVFPLRFPSLSVAKSPLFSPSYRPVKSRQAGKIFSVNDGVESLCEGDVANRLVLRLDWLVSLHEWHILTSNEKLRPSGRTSIITRRILLCP